jgi:hypothetical protein
LEGLLSLGVVIQHVRNILFRRLIAKHAHLYCNIKDGQKHLLPREIVDKIRSTVRSTGGQFLKNKSGAWVEISQERAKQKAQVLLQAYALNESHSHAGSCPSSVLTPRAVAAHTRTSTTSPFVGLTSMILEPVSSSCFESNNRSSNLDDVSTIVHQILPSPVALAALDSPEAGLDNTDMVDDASFIQGPKFAYLDNFFGPWTLLNRDTYNLHAKSA